MNHLPIKQLEAINDIYKKIIKLPTLNLKDKQLSNLAYFIDYQDIQSIEQLNSLLTDEGKWLLEEPQSEQILEYLKAWLTLGAVMVECVMYFRSLWSDQIGKPFGSDTLVPLLMELLPDDKSQLKALIKPLTIATQVSLASMYACYLTNLYAAVTAKVTDNSYQPDKEVKEMAGEIKSLALITQLHLTCMEHLDGLLGKIRKTIVIPNAPKPAITIPENEEEALQLLNEIEDDDQSSELAPLINEYRIIWDLNISLLREKKTSAERLSEFEAKFNHLQQAKNPALDTAFLQKIKTIHPPLPLLQSSHEPFLQTALNFFKRKETPKAQIPKDNPSPNPAP